MTARTDPETVRAHVNRINRWQTASEHQYPGPYRAFLHEWCRYPVSGEGRTNALVSPLGIGAVLAMLSQGAVEPVRRAIGEMLGGWAAFHRTRFPAGWRRCSVPRARTRG